jgi:hypothetical protein
MSGLTLRLLVVGIPRYWINPFADLLVKWSECSGEEWTVKRCKSLKLTLIHLRAGIQPSDSFARNRRGEYKGVVGSLLRYGLKSDKNFSQVLNAFMAYTHWTSVKLQKTQKDKFLTAVNAKDVEIHPSLKRALKRTTRAFIGQHTISGKPQSLLTWRGSPNKRAPSFNKETVSQSSKILAELMLTNNYETWEHIKLHYDGIYSEVFDGINIHEFIDSCHYDDIDMQPMCAGEVHFLQEPGYKLRSIASPYRLFQVASEPLKNELGRIVSNLEWDCTHNQEKAFPTVQELLRKHKTVYSVDLSNATDYFPFSLQKLVLEQVFGKKNPYVSLFDDVSRSVWHSEIGDIRWNKGQPLGFNPSFFSFTLTHGLLLQTLSGASSWNHEFFIVGDDVLITNKKLFDNYCNCLEQLGCPYSPEKSLVSNELAEFAGKIILPDKVFPQLKWRDTSDENFLDLARLIGRNIRFLLTKKQNQVLDVFAHIPDFIHPMGLNWSYPGSNLELMVAKGLSLCFEERVLNSLTGLSRHIHNQIYSDYGVHTNDLIGTICKDRTDEIVHTFDEKVKSVFLRSGFARKHYEYFLEYLKDIPEALCDGSNHHKLPLEDRPPSRVTTLQRLSKYVNT